MDWNQLIYQAVNDDNKTLWLRCVQENSIYVLDSIINAAALNRTRIIEYILTSESARQWILLVAMGAIDSSNLALFLRSYEKIARFRASKSVLTHGELNEFVLRTVQSRALAIYQFLLTLHPAKLHEAAKEAAHIGWVDAIESWLTLKTQGASWCSYCYVSKGREMIVLDGPDRDVLLSRSALFMMQIAARAAKMNAEQVIDTMSKWVTKVNTKHLQPIMNDVLIFEAKNGNTHRIQHCLEDGATNLGEALGCAAYYDRAAAVTLLLTQLEPDVTEDVIRECIYLAQLNHAYSVLSLLLAVLEAQKSERQLITKLEAVHV